MSEPLAAASKRYPLTPAQQERVAAWLAAQPEPNVSLERRQAAARKLLGLVAEKRAREEAA